MSTNIFNLNLERTALYNLFDEMKVEYDKSICDNEMLSLQNVTIDSKFKIKIESKIPDLIETNNYPIVKINEFYINTQVHRYKSVIGDIEINEMWHTKVFIDLFTKAITDIFPRILKSNPINILPKSKNIFKWTCYTNPINIKAIFLYHNPYISFKYTEDAVNNIAFAVNPIYKSNALLEMFFNKMCFQLDVKLNYPEWFNNGNIYNYMSDILFLNIGQTISIQSNKIINHLKYWKLFIKNLIKLLLQMNENIKIICFGSDSEKLVSSISNIKNVVYDLDPIVKNKPHDYLSTPPYFKELHDIFLK